MKLLQILNLNRIIQALIYSDVLFFSAFGMLSPVYAVFIEQRIVGGTLTVVGISTAIFLIVKSFVQMIVAAHLDIKEDDKKNFYWTLGGGIALATVPIFYLYISVPWHLYIIEALLATGSAANFPAWSSLFTKHLDQRRRAFQWSFHSTATQLGTAVAAAGGGYIADHFGFSYLIYILIAFAWIGVLSLAPLYFFIRSIEKKEKILYTLEALPLKINEQLMPADDSIKSLALARYGNDILSQNRRKSLARTTTSLLNKCLKQCMRIMV